MSSKRDHTQCKIWVVLVLSNHNISIPISGDENSPIDFVPYSENS